MSQSDIQPGSPRGFGLTFAFIAALIALWPLAFGGESIRVWAAVVAVFFLLTGLFVPGLLKPLNLLWFKFGMLLAKVINPVIMTAVFVLTVVPTGIVMRLLGKRPLQLNPPKEGSLWQPADKEKSSFRNQF